MLPIVPSAMGGGNVRVVILAAAEFSAPLTEHEVLLVIVQLLALVGVARIFGWVMKSVNQPPVVGELLAGVVLGPTVLGNIAPSAHDWLFGDPTVRSVVFGFSWLAVILLLVVIGFETDLGIIARFKVATLSVSAGALLLPLLLFFFVGQAAPDSFVGEGVDKTVFAGFLALALSVSALPVVAKILQDLGYMRRNFAQITLAAAMTIDSTGWLFLAAGSGVAQGGFQPGGLARSFGGLVVFLLVVATVGRWVVDRLFRFVLARGSSVTSALSITILAALIGAAVTQALHLEAIIGAFVVGVILATIRHRLPQVPSTLETFTAAFFAPIFFAYSGLRVDVGLLNTAEAAIWAAGLIIAAVIAKILGTVIGGYFAGIRGREAMALGSALSALGAMGIVVAIVGLNLGVVSETGYTVMVLAAIVTSLTSPQFLRWVVSGWTVPTEEAQRLQREELRDSSVILRSSRILLPTRGGRNSSYAARILASSFPESEITVLAVDRTPATGLRKLLTRNNHNPTDASDVMTELDESPNARLERRLSADPIQTIAKEASLGYDLVVLGASENEDSSTFNTAVDRLLSLIDVPTLVVRFPVDGHVPEHLPERVLVPVTATRSTRAAEELAYSITRHSDGTVLALHVVNRPEGQGMMLEEPALQEGMRTGQDLVDEAAEYGERLGARVLTSVRVAPNAEQEILEVASREEVDLLILGAPSRTLTNRPFFGHRVSYMIERSTIPVAVVSIPAQPTTATFH
ncbi:MAG: hypothetical protein GEU71_16805 [Actinobacteria bacterium]|nr:hypothetical protein [Actinomycetota bacterium]